MASSSNRNYRIFLNSEINKALDILGLSAVPEIEGLDG